MVIKRKWLKSADLVLRSTGTHRDCYEMRYDYLDVSKYTWPTQVNTENELPKQIVI